MQYILISMPVVAPCVANIMLLHFHGSIEIITYLMALSMCFDLTRFQITFGNRKHSACTYCPKNKIVPLQAQLTLSMFYFSFILFFQPNNNFYFVWGPPAHSASIRLLRVFFFLNYAKLRDSHSHTHLVGP